MLTLPVLLALVIFEFTKVPLISQQTVYNKFESFGYTNKRNKENRLLVSTHHDISYPNCISKAFKFVHYKVSHCTECRR